jgi:outer membrane protein assembly factor BamB
MKSQVCIAGMVCLLAFRIAAADFATGTDWPSYGGTHSALRYSSLDQINTSNVQALAPAWIFQTGDPESGLQATPIVIDGVMYVSSASNWVFALDAASGSIRWEYRYPWPRGLVPAYGRQNRGVAVGNGRVFMGTADNYRRRTQRDFGLPPLARREIGTAHHHEKRQPQAPEDQEAHWQRARHSPGDVPSHL